MKLNWPVIMANTLLAWINGALFAAGAWIFGVDMSSDVFYVGLMLVFLLTPNADD